MAEVIYDIESSDIISVDDFGSAKQTSTINLNRLMDFSKFEQAATPILNTKCYCYIKKTYSGYDSCSEGSVYGNFMNCNYFSATAQLTHLDEKIVSVEIDNYYILNIGIEDFSKYFYITKNHYILISKIAEYKAFNALTMDKFDMGAEEFMLEIEQLKEEYPEKFL